MSLDRFCRKPLVTVKPEDTVQRAAELMREHHVGSVMVVDSQRRPVGIVTDRDLVCGVMVPQLDPMKTAVRQLMSAGLGVAQKSDLIDQALLRMRELGTRRLPIVDPEGKAIGIVTLDDLMVMLTGELTLTASVIRSNRGP